MISLLEFDFEDTIKHAARQFVSSDLELGSTSSRALRIKGLMNQESEAGEKIFKRASGGDSFAVEKNLGKRFSEDTKDRFDQSVRRLDREIDRSEHEHAGKYGLLNKAKYHGGNFGDEVRVRGKAAMRATGLDNEQIDKVADGAKVVGGGAILGIMGKKVYDRLKRK